MYTRSYWILPMEVSRIDEIHHMLLLVDLKLLQRKITSSFILLKRLNFRGMYLTIFSLIFITVAMPSLQFTLCMPLLQFTLCMPLLHSPCASRLFACFLYVNLITTKQFDIGSCGLTLAYENISDKTNLSPGYRMNLTFFIFHNTNCQEPWFDTF